MDLKQAVFNAVINGDLPQLIKTLKPLGADKEKIKEIITQTLDDKTPLLIAARLGRCDILEYLILHCYADVEQVGKVEFDGERIDNAPPLWCSAAVGCLKCVQLLLDNGANVNSTTSTNSTPLRAACFDGHFEIVQLLVDRGADIEITNQHGHTCLMISCFKKHYDIASYLISKGARINRQSCKGNTALHDCAESNCMDIMKLLVRNGAEFMKDGYDLTPIMTAALTGNRDMVEYLIAAYNCSIKDQVDAYKLLGATYVDKFHDISIAFEYWRHALHRSKVRCDTTNKRIAPSDYYREAYADVLEFQTEDDLNDLYCDPDRMKMQSLIIRERILSARHPETYYFIRFRGATYADSGDYNRCLSLWMYYLERLLEVNKPLCENTQSFFLAINELFAILFSKCNSSVRICDIFRMLKCAIRELLPPSLDILPDDCPNASHQQLYPAPVRKRPASQKENASFNGDASRLDRHFLIVIQLIGFVCQLRPRLSDYEWNTFKKSLYEFVSLDPRSACSYTLLHVLCVVTENDIISHMKTSVFEIFSLIVDVSSNLDVIDVCGNTPLHLLFKRKNLRLDMINYLLKRDAHLDLNNEEGLSPLDYLREEDRNKYKVKFLSLQCLCAQSIAKWNIPFDGLSQGLRACVRLHQNRGDSSCIYEKVEASLTA